MCVELWIKTRWEPTTPESPEASVVKETVTAKVEVVRRDRVVWTSTFPSVVRRLTLLLLLVLLWLLVTLKIFDEIEDTCWAKKGKKFEFVQDLIGNVNLQELHRKSAALRMRNEELRSSCKASFSSSLASCDDQKFWRRPRPLPLPRLHHLQRIQLLRSFCICTSSVCGDCPSCRPMCPRTCRSQGAASGSWKGEGMERGWGLDWEGDWDWGLDLGLEGVRPQLS